jgi:hypothetical protein
MSICFFLIIHPEILVTNSFIQDGEYEYNAHIVESNEVTQQFKNLCKTIQYLIWNKDIMLIEIHLKMLLTKQKDLENECFY